MEVIERKVTKNDASDHNNGGGVNSSSSHSADDGYGSVISDDSSAVVSTRGADEHLGKHRQYWRDIILGVNDGLVSTFLLVAGVAGGGLSSNDILLTAIAGALAGAVSMASGEYVATKSQNEVMRGEIALEQTHIEQYHMDELRELTSLLDMIGITSRDGSLRDSLVTFYEHNPEALLKIMKVLEFGVVEEEQRSPLMAGITSGSLFILGSLPSIIPFATSDEPGDGLIFAACFTVLALMVVGIVKTWATRGNCFHAALENLIIAGMGGVLAYGVGALFEKII